MDAYGKVAIVTGAGSGVGRASRVALLGEGYAVGAGRAAREGARSRPGDEGAGPGERALAVPTDVRDPAAVAGSSPARARRSGDWTCCSTTPGDLSPSGLLEDLTYEQWPAVVDVNLTGAFLCTQEAFRLMKGQEPRGGRIINNGSSPPTPRVRTPRPTRPPSTR